jgi:primosomal protein N' (replication factor Y)
MSDFPDSQPGEPQALQAVEAARHIVQVALDVPIDDVFDYCANSALPAGARVIVPFGRRKLVGVVVSAPDRPAFQGAPLKSVIQVLDDTPALPAEWLALARFAARYYQRPLGEVMLPVLPAPLRKVTAYQGARSAGGPVARLQKRQTRAGAALASGAAHVVEPDPEPPLTDEQQAACDAITTREGHHCFLLYGITGSGKTEVYLRAAQSVLAQGKQVLFLVPEINLTPQFETALRRRLARWVSDDPAAVAVMHSGLTDSERLDAWLRVAQGRARILLGTRLSLFVPLPDPGLIIVDEEHDTSYKQQEGLRYSARDLAVWRAHQRGIPVVLGSATPSLESWHHAQTGRYALLRLTRRARAAQPPAVTLVDTRRATLQHGFTPQVLKAITDTLQQGQQALVFLNRRGYAPVLHCGACGWVSQCPRCTAYAVVHRSTPTGVAQGRVRHQLHCHHCGYQSPVPRACPGCGNIDTTPMGRGTQRVEHELAEWFPQARIARIDADSTRRKGSAAELFAQVHAGDIDILVGTQMVAKGHDFANLGLVAVVNADTMLFAQDFRAPERLFAQLMQVAGRAGRHGRAAQVLVQTDYPDQAVYQALIAHDYDSFARYSLQERESIGLPPFAWQALLTAEARRLPDALAFLHEAKDIPAQLQRQGEALAGASAVTLYDPVPLRVVRVANVERAQLLVESSSRPALQHFLAQWRFHVAALATGHKVRITLEVDPMEI